MKQLFSEPEVLKHRMEIVIDQLMKACNVWASSRQPEIRTEISLMTADDAFKQEEQAGLITVEIRN